MGKLRLVAVSLLTFAAACGDDGGATPQDGGGSGSADARPIDAMPIDMPPEVQYDYSCPTTAPTDIATTVTVSGTAQQLNGTTNVAAMGVVITAYRINSGGDQVVDTSAPTPANGVFSTAQIATNGTALNGYLKGTKATYWPTYLYPASPLAQSLTGVPVIMINDANVELAETLGQTDQLPGNGIIGVALTDCAQPPAQIPNATIEVYSGTTRVGNDTLDIGAILGPNFPDVQGLYLVPNVPPGPVTVRATYYSHTFLENDVVSYADSLTTAQIRPGY
jgi:hypothetical protein